MKVFNRSFLLVAVSIFVLYYCSVYYLESNFSVSFMDTLFIQIFKEFELPSWLMVVLGFVVLVNLIKMVSARLFKVKNYNFLYIILVFQLSSCYDLTRGCGGYPSPSDWNEACEFNNPTSANYTALFAALERIPSFNLYLPVEGVYITCKVIKVQRLQHPHVPDSCYWSGEVVLTKSGITTEFGTWSFDFPMQFASVGDYFILEGSFQKFGYFPELFSNDGRYFYYNNSWIPCNTTTVNMPFRTTFVAKNLLSFNLSP